MNFNTVTFIFYLLPFALIAYHVVPANFRMLVIFTSSLIFYGASGFLPLCLLISTIAWGYLTSNYISLRVGSGTSIAICASFPLAMLWLFKYLGFTLDVFSITPSGDGVFATISSILMPAGISFYTFQVMSYCIDVSDRKIVPERNFIKFGAYISFFPQLIAGPIVRYAEIQSQLEYVRENRNLSIDIIGALKLFSFGLLAKTVGADLLLILQERYNVATPTGSLDALYSVISYSFIIYFDFWAYSIMAIGLGRLFGIELPRNFRQPYNAFSPKEFWRLWHITLSYWIRDYLYIRLGGNRRYVTSILIAFLATGLWHGAGTNFLIWGLYHACLVVCYHWTKQWWDVLPKWCGIAITFSLVSLGWPLFYLDSSSWLDLIREIFSFRGTGEPIYIARHWGVLIALAAWTFFVRDEFWLFNEKRRIIFDSPIVHASTIILCILLFSFGREFIYFRF